MLGNQRVQRVASCGSCGINAGEGALCGADHRIVVRLIPAIILSVSILIASLIWVSVPLFFPPKVAGVAGGSGSVDNNARIDIELLHGDMDAQNEIDHPAEGSG